MKNMKNKIIKPLTIFAIMIAIITTIAIAAKSEPKKFNSVDELKDDENTKVGDTINLDGNTWKGRDDYFCFEHKGDFESGEYKIEDIIEITGKNATNKATKKTVTNKTENLIMAYILCKGNYSKLMYMEGENPNNLMSGRNIAIWAYQHTWINSLGVNFFSKNWSTQGDNGWKHWDANRLDFNKYFTGQNKKEVEDAKKLIEEAKDYAKKYKGAASIVLTGQKNINSVTDDMFGPFKARFSADTISLKVINNSNKDITNSIKIYDKERKKEIGVSGIKSNEEFYIKGRDLKKVTVTATSEFMKVKMFLLSKDNFWEGLGQNMLIVKPEIKPDVAHIDFNVNSKGILRIKKIDADYPDKVLGAGFKIYREGYGWLYGTKDGYTYYKNEDVKKASTYQTYRFKDEEGFLKLEGLEYGIYKIYEVETPSKDYKLSEQGPGYSNEGNWERVYFGDAKVGGRKEERDVTKTIKNHKQKEKISIKGYVWIDQHDTKETGLYNSVYDEGLEEVRVSGVKVRLKDKKTGKSIVKNSDGTDYVLTNSNGEYVFEKIVTADELKNYYVEFDYKGLKSKYTKASEEEEITGYIPVDFNSEDVNKIVKNGSRALMDNIPYKDYAEGDNGWGIATTYKGTDAAGEKTYGIGKGSNLYNSKELMVGDTLTNINLGLKRPQKVEFSVEQTVASVRIVMKGYTYTYNFGDNDKENIVITENMSLPKVKLQTSSITGYKASVNPSYIAYDRNNSTEELKLYVKYKINITNNADYTMPGQYYEEALHITNLVNQYDKERYNLYDSNWEEIEKGKAKFKNVKDVYGNNPIERNKNAVSYITFSVNHDKILEILKHPDGIFEELPTEAFATGNHTYTRNESSWAPNTIYKEKQRHQTNDTTDSGKAPYLVFKLGSERILSGKVFKDNIVTDNGEKLGNGIIDKDEKGVEGVKVELIDAEKLNNIRDITEKEMSELKPSNLYNVLTDQPKDEKGELKSISVSAIVLTDKDGNYSMKGIVPGDYFLRFTYGDGTYKYLNAEGKEENITFESKIEGKGISPKIYKSTIVPNNSVVKKVFDGVEGNGITKEEEFIQNEEGKLKKNYIWYKSIKDSNLSVALDNLEIRAAVNSNNNVTAQMAVSPKISITIENTIKNVSDIEITNAGGVEGGKAVVNNEFGGLNFGIIEQPTQRISLDKIITNISFVNGQGNMSFNGNPETDEKLKEYGVMDLDLDPNNGGSKSLKAEIAEQYISAYSLGLTYKIKVTNTSDVNYYNNDYYWYGVADQDREVTIDVKELLDYLDENLEYDKDATGNTNIKVIDSTEITDENLKNKTVLSLAEAIGKLYTNKNKNRNDGNREYTIDLVANKRVSINDNNDSVNDDKGEYINDVELKNIKVGADEKDNKRDVKEIEKDLQKIRPIQANLTSRAVAIITPPTGSDRQTVIIYTIAAIISLAILSAGIIMVKKILTK